MIREFLLVLVMCHFFRFIIFMNCGWTYDVLCLVCWGWCSYVAEIDIRLTPIPRSMWESITFTAAASNLDTGYSRVNWGRLGEDFLGLLKTEIRRAETNGKTKFKDLTSSSSSHLILFYHSSSQNQISLAAQPFQMLLLLSSWLSVDVFLWLKLF